LFGAIAGVLGYQRQCAILIMSALIVGVVFLLIVENLASTAMKQVSDDLEKINKAMPTFSVPRVRKFD
jgi:hypothetical protein